MSFATILSFAPILLFVHCLIIFNFKKWLGPHGTFYSSITILLLVITSSVNELYLTLLHGNYYYIDFGKWFFCLDLIDSQLVFCADALALLATSLVSLLTALALFFGVEYMYRESFINRLLYLLNLFATSVIFLFFCYDFFLIILAWECIGLFSFLLVNFYSIRIYTIKAALKTFVFSRFSDLLMFLSFILTIVIFNTSDLSLLFLQTPFMAFNYVFLGQCGIHLLSFFTFCLATSGVIKAAQFFFHVWLPDAMEAPTPASALIHSSTLVVAGVFLIIRFSVLFEFTILINYYLAVLGALTLAFGAVSAIFQNDIKKLVAYSTISQIGYLVCGCGFGCYNEVFLYLIVHALNKAFLFILVGYLVHYFNGNTDMRQMGGSYLYSFDITIFLAGTCLNLAGLPYTAGFLNKEFLLFQILKDDFLSYTVRTCWLISFLFTPVYMLILVFIVVFGAKKGAHGTYSPLWNFNYFLNWKIKIRKNVSLLFLCKTRLQYSSITGRLTSLILAIFWIFFFTFGEYFLMLLFEYSSVSDLIVFSFFFNLKYVNPLNPIFATARTVKLLMGLIVLSAVTSLLFLINLRYTFFLKLKKKMFLHDAFYFTLTCIIFVIFLF